MDNFETDAPAPRRSLRTLAILSLAALLLAAALALHKAPRPEVWRQSLESFRGDEGLELKVSPHMNAILILRNDLRQALAAHQPCAISPSQNLLLLDSLNGPADDLLQSEALDVLGLAARAHALSPMQSRAAVTSALAILSGTPGPMVRLEGARFLSHTGDARGLPTLGRLAQDPSPRIREAALARR